MARKKTPSESVRAKLALAERLVALRSELHGNRGATATGAAVGHPLPDLVQLRDRGYGPRRDHPKDHQVDFGRGRVAIGRERTEVPFCASGAGRARRPLRATAVVALLRTALHLLESSEATSPRLDGESAASESADRGPTAMDVSPLSQELTTVQHGRWSERSASDPGSIDSSANPLCARSRHTVNSNRGTLPRTIFAGEAPIAQTRTARDQTNAIPP